MIYFYNFEISNIKSRRHDNQEKHQIFAEEAEKCGSSEKWSDRQKIVAKKKKTTELIVYI